MRSERRASRNPGDCDSRVSIGGLSAYCIFHWRIECLLYFSRVSIGELLSDYRILERVVILVIVTVECVLVN